MSNENGNNNEKRRFNNGSLDTTVIGTVTSDLEVTEVKSEKNGKVTNYKQAKFSVAVNRYNKETEFVRVTLWGKAAERYANILRKGTLVKIVGELSMHTYNGKSSLEITELFKVSPISGFGKKQENSDAQANTDDDTEDYPDITDSIGDAMDGFMEIPADSDEDEDMPF